MKKPSLKEQVRRKWYRLGLWWNGRDNEYHDARSRFSVVGGESEGAKRIVFDFLGKHVKLLIKGVVWAVAAISLGALYKLGEFLAERVLK